MQERKKINMTWFRLRKSHRTLIYGCIVIIVLLGLAWNYSYTRFPRRSSGSSFDVFDVHGLFPGQRVLSGQTPGMVQSAYDGIEIFLNLYYFLVLI